ncbi:hypothetical protein PUN4_1120006 [Paraburkholderia unamae]|nr:hypothetical protein PUN4_1120006 [Paraburkholderia unamae]
MQHAKRKPCGNPQQSAEASSRVLDDQFSFAEVGKDGFAASVKFGACFRETMELTCSARIRTRKIQSRQGRTCCFVLSQELGNKPAGCPARREQSTPADAIVRGLGLREKPDRDISEGESGLTRRQLAQRGLFLGHCSALYWPRPIFPKFASRIAVATSISPVYLPYACGQ